MTWAYKHTCATCGETHDPNLKPPKPRWEPLTRKHTSALYKLLLAVRHYGRNSIHIRREMVDIEGAPFQLTKDEWTNFTKLRYHALAVKVKGKPGYWLFTKRAGEFLKGYVPVPKEVAVLDGHPVEHSKKLVYLRDLSLGEPWYAQMPAFNVEAPEKMQVELRQSTLI